MAFIEIVEGALGLLSATSLGAESGAEVLFQGRVRGEENETRIVALYYEAYEDMALRELTAIRTATLKNYPLQYLACRHAKGLVPVGEVAIQVLALAKHRQAALDGVGWFVDQVKHRVPIWKWGVTADGRRFPSAGGHALNPDSDRNSV